MDPTSCSSVGCDSCRLILCIGSDFRPADGGLRLPVESSEELDPALSAGESGTPMVTSLSSFSYVVAADIIFSRLLLVACEYNEASKRVFAMCRLAEFPVPIEVSRQTMIHMRDIMRATEPEQRSSQSFFCACDPIISS